MARPKGSPKLGGRQKGTPNKVTAAVKDAVCMAFAEVGGAEYLVQVARTDPRTFCGLLGKVIPLDVAVAGNMTLNITVGGK